MGEKMKRKKYHTINLDKTSFDYLKFFCKYYGFSKTVYLKLLLRDKWQEIPNNEKEKCISETYSETIPDPIPPPIPVIEKPIDLSGPAIFSGTTTQMDKMKEQLLREQY